MLFVAAQEIDEEALLCLTDNLIVPLLPNIGARAKFMSKLQVLKTQV
jgi:hypothetical protein